ncbi:MAG: hypothetical protein V7785_02795 [Bermanella sp.]
MGFIKQSFKFLILDRIEYILIAISFLFAGFVMGQGVDVKQFDIWAFFAGFGTVGLLIVAFIVRNDFKKQYFHRMDMDALNWILNNTPPLTLAELSTKMTEVFGRLKKFQSGSQRLDDAQLNDSIREFRELVASIAKDMRTISSFGNKVSNVQHIESLKDAASQYLIIEESVTLHIMVPLDIVKMKMEERTAPDFIESLKKPHNNTEKFNESFKSLTNRKDTINKLKELNSLVISLADSVLIVLNSSRRKF